MFPLGPEGSPEPDIVGTADADRARPRWWRYVVTGGGVLALAVIIAVTFLSRPGEHTAAHRPGGVPVRPAVPAVPDAVPAVPDAVPSQAWVSALNIASWPAPGSDSSMFAGGVAGRGGWELTLRDVARPGQRCAAAVVLDGLGAHSFTRAYPIPPHPASPAPAGDLAFIALGAPSPGVGVGFLQLGGPAAQVWADPHRIGGLEISAPVLAVRACGQRYYLAGFAYPLAGTLDVFVAGRNGARPVHYLVPARLSRPSAPRVWQSTSQTHP
jgi:hypothetical protein